MHRIVILASGGGSNAEKIIEHFALLSAEAIVVAVLSDRKEAGVHAKASGLGVRSEWLSPKTRRNPGSLLQVLRKHRADLIVLAGYLQLVPLEVLASFPARVINIHPALLPKFGGPGMYGQHVHQAVAAAGDRYSGITIHLADEHYDRGRILFQATTPLSGQAEPEEIAKQVLLLEHRYYPAVLAAYLQQLNPQEATTFASPIDSP